MLFNKKGDQIIDASIVIPIFILIVSALISVCAFSFSALRNQADLHDDLIKEMNKSSAVFTIKNKTIETSNKIGGIFRVILKKKSQGRIYIMSQSEIIRVGEMLELDYEDE